MAETSEDISGDIGINAPTRSTGGQMPDQPEGIGYDIRRYANNEKAIAHLEDAERILNSAHHVLGFGTAPQDIRNQIDSIKDQVGDIKRELASANMDFARTMLNEMDLPLSPMARFRAAVADAQERFVIGLDVDEDVLTLTLPISAEDDEHPNQHVRGCCQRRARNPQVRTHWPTWTRRSGIRYHARIHGIRRGQHVCLRRYSPPTHWVLGGSKNLGWLSGSTIEHITGEDTLFITISREERDEYIRLAQDMPCRQPRYARVRKRPPVHNGSYARSGRSIYRNNVVLPHPRKALWGLSLRTVARAEQSTNRI